MGKLVHGDNLAQKEHQKTKYVDEVSRKYLSEIRSEYNNWHHANVNLTGPVAAVSDNDLEVVTKRTGLFEDYKEFLEQQKYAEKFDSRSNLHSSALEEFIYYLFKDLVAEFGEHALIGKSHTFKDIFFFPTNYREMVKRPYARIEKKDHDFVIGTTVNAVLTSGHAAQGRKDHEQRISMVARLPEDPDQVRVVGSTETHSFDIAAVAIECKTYLDKTMLEGSSRAAEELKMRSPNAIYIVVAEWLKLTEAINLKKYKVDQIYVLRKQKNTDREFRFEEGYLKNPIYEDVVWHLFQTVRNHLVDDWSGGVAHGLERGWLVD
jgi:hypothetical protein